VALHVVEPSSVYLEEIRTASRQASVAPPSAVEQILNVSPSEASTGNANL